MGILEGLFGGGGDSLNDLYGDLLTDKQRAALRDQQMGQGLLRMAGAFADAGMPSRMPIPFGSAIGKAAQAFGGGQEEALKGIMTAAQIRELQAKAKIREQMFGPEANAKMDALFAALSGGGTRVPAAPLPPRIPTGGGPTAGPPASNAPPPPPVALTPDADLMGGYGGGPPAMPAAGSAGLLPPPGGSGLPGIGTLAFLMNGGGAPGGTPFAPSAARPGVAGPDRPIDIELLSGEAAPVLADEALRRTSPVPSLGGRPLPASAWQVGTRYDRGDTPFDPANPRATPEQFAAPPSELDRLSQLMKVETLAKPAASTLTGSNWEIANNNFGGMRRPGVNASPSQGGFQTFATPEEGLAGISRQLDRYASGATTGKPLSTIREIVSTWAPPSENDTETLIKRATRVMGVADNIPLNISDPAVKAKLIEATIRNEQGGNLPVDPALIGQVAGASPDTYASGRGDYVIPSGRGTPRSALRNVADTGGGPAAPGSGMPPLPGLPGTGGVPAPGAAGNPQAMNALLLELARRNAAAEMLGMGNPYGSMLQVLQGTPQYKGQIKGAEEEATLPYVRPKASEQAAGEQPYKLQGIQYQGQVNAALKTLEQLGAARLDIVPNIPVPDGKGGTIERQGTREQAVMVAHGFDVPEIGFKGIHGPMPGAPAAQAPGGGGDAGGVPLAGKEQISEAQKARIGIDAQLAKEVGDQALQARRLLPLVDEALVLARKTPEGLAGPASAKIGQIAAAFGVAPTPGQSNAEALGAINQRLIPLVREPGAQSNAEMDAYLASGPGLMLTADGRVKIAEMTKAIGQRAIAVAEVYRDTIGEPSSVRRAKLDALDKPLFTPEQRAAMETVSKPQAVPPGGSAAAPIDKATYDKLPPGAPYTGPDGITRTKR